MTARLAGALTTQVVEDVSLAAERVSKIVGETAGVDAATNSHAAERRRLDDDHVIVTGAARSECLQLAVFSPRVCHIV